MVTGGAVASVVAVPLSLLVTRLAVEVAGSLGLSLVLQPVDPDSRLVSSGAAKNTTSLKQ